MFDENQNLSNYRALGHIKEKQIKSGGKQWQSELEKKTIKKTIQCNVYTPDK